MTLQEHWELEQLPNIGNICFSNGKIINFNENRCIKDFTYIESKIEDFGSDVEEIEVYESLYNQKNGYVAHRGAGCMGNVGFIAYTDNKNRIIWSLLLDFSNPFWSFYFEGNNIIAKTEIDYEFVIPVTEPEKMSCTSYNHWGY